MKNSRIPLYAALCISIVGALFMFGPLLHLLGHSGHSHSHGAGTYKTAGGLVVPIIGIALVYLSLFVYRRRLLAAYSAAAVGLAMSLYALLAYLFSPLTLLILVMMGIYCTLLFIGKRAFIIKNNLEDFPRHLRPIIIVAVVGLLYGIFGFYTLGHFLFHTQFSIASSITTTIDGLTGMSGALAIPTRAGHFFVDSLGGIGIVIFILLVEALFRPLRLKALPYQETADHRDAELLIRSFSTSSEDYFKLWPGDKHYFFSRHRRAFLAYKPSGHTIVILGDPVGEVDAFPELIEDFTAYCHSLGWQIAVVNVTDASQRLFEQYGLKSLFIGSEGIVNIEEFIDSTSRNKHFRYVANKALRDELEVKEWKTLDDDQLAQLEAISKQWLERGGRREYTFFMGYFDRTYLQNSRVFVLLQAGEVVAYINSIQSFYKHHESIDHFRSSAAMSPVGMHYLLLEVIKTLHAEAAQTLNIGLVPLSGMDESNEKVLPRTTLKLIRRFGSSYYSFQGLEQFKNKFKPQWERRALLYTGSLLRVTKDTERAAVYVKKSELQFYVSTFVGVVVLAVGIYFIVN